MTRICRTATRRISAKAAVLLFMGVCVMSPLPQAFAAPGGGGGTGGGNPSSSAPRRNVDPAESFREGMEALEAGEYSKAEKKFREVLSVAKDHPETNYYMGLTKVKRGKAKSSRRYFQRAIKERPGFVEAREQLALVYVELGDPEKAGEQLAALKEMIVTCQAEGCGDGRIAFLNETVARVETAMAAAPDEVSDAGAAETVAILLQPREAGVAQYQAAVRLINEQRFAEAIDELYRSQAVIGPHPDILNYLGFSHRKMMQFEDAEKYYRQALAIDPDHLGANEYLGEMYLELGEMDKAKEQLAILDGLCAFGCAEREDLARLIEIKQSVRRAENSR